ncbi:MAG: hypothetical protein H7A34_09430 [bacterium]|nr:hypothetical protein [bacterium]
MLTSLLGATLAEWQKKREEEDAARRASMQNSGGEEEDDRPRKKTPGQIAYEKKQQQKRIVAESQALMNQKKATQQAQSKIAKDKNLAKAESEMDKVKPVTPYVASSYLDKEEETWLKGVASQGAWAAVNAREEAKKAEQERLNNVYAARWAGLASVAQENNGGLLSMLWNASISALGTIASPLKNIYSNKGDNPTVGETLVPRPSRWTIYYLPDQAVMKTYLAASINVQSDGKNVDEKDKNSHLGPAQLSRNELDTPYKTGFNDDGSICERANCRGYGLGLPGEDPNDNVTAVRGMGRRIQQVFDRAENLSEKYNIILTNTDKYIIAAMAQNGPGFDYNDINRVMTPENGFITDSQINWEAYFEVKQGEWEERVNQANKNPLTKESAEVILYNSLFFTNGADFDTRYSLEKFYDETSNLEDKGYSLPQDLDIERIKELITNDLSTGVRE